MRKSPPVSTLGLGEGLAFSVGRGGGCTFERVDMGEGWCDNPSGSRPNSFGRQHLTFDKGGKFSARQGIVRFWKGWSERKVLKLIVVLP